MLAFAITMILENSINIAARRIYSSKCDYFVDAHIFVHKKKRITNITSFDVTQNLQYTSTLSKNGVFFF